jgi:glycosyltransferase involved in cell wall biosynthesis
MDGYEVMIVIAQPWFSASGHPAQSLINLARIIGNLKEIIYLVSVLPDNVATKEALGKLKLLGDVVDFPVKTTSIREGTLKALLSLKKLFALDASIDRVFFLDAHLVLLSALWPFYAQRKIKQLGVVYLMGPERVARYSLVKYLISIFLQRREVVLFLRTEELVADWKIAFPEACIKCLPSLELPFDQELVVEEQLVSKTIHLGVLGQIRTGKSLEWLVPLFKINPSIGKLTVAGAFSQPAERKRLTVLEEFEGFQDKFLGEEEMLKLASKQDYLLMLYDNWDHRMEGAVMFLAARVNRPVVVYNKGWCGRMVKTYGNGVFAPEDNKNFITFVENLPQRGSVAYQKLLEGVAIFKHTHSDYSVRLAFLDLI